MHVVGGEDDTHDFGQRLAAPFGDVSELSGSLISRTSSARSP
jgi:hypothetical protein